MITSIFSVNKILDIIYQEWKYTIEDSLESILNYISNAKSMGKSESMPLKAQKVVHPTEKNKI